MGHKRKRTDQNETHVSHMHVSVRGYNRKVRSVTLEREVGTERGNTTQEENERAREEGV